MRASEFTGLSGRQTLKLSHTPQSVQNMNETYESVNFWFPSSGGIFEAFIWFSKARWGGWPSAPDFGEASVANFGE